MRNKLNRIVVESRIGSDGVLHLDIPVGRLAAGMEVRITVDPLGSSPSAEEWRRCILETAGKWEGEFERPEPGEYEEREPLS